MAYLSDPRNHPHKQLPEYFGALPAAALFGSGLAFLDGGLWISNGTAWTEVAAANGDSNISGDQAVTGDQSVTGAATFEGATTFEGVATFGSVAAAIFDGAGLEIANTSTAVAITAISKAADAVITVASHTFVAGDVVRIGGVVGMTQINGIEAAVVSVDATHVTITTDSQAFSTYVSGGTLVGLTNISTTITGGLVVTSAIGVPTTPATGKVVLWWDETNKTLKIKDSAGTIENVIVVAA